jgi:hypothetical protein
MTNRTSAVIVAAAAIGALAWIGPLFIPLVLLGPLVSGLVGGAYGVDSRTVALVWFLGGMLMLVSDLVIYNEDVAFHATLAVFTAAGRGRRRVGRPAHPRCAVAGAVLRRLEAQVAHAVLAPAQVMGQLVAQRALRPVARRRSRSWPKSRSSVSW